MTAQKIRLNSSIALALAAQSCSICFGLGIRQIAERKICRCVWRRIFRISYARFRECDGSGLKSAADAEYRADFCYVGRSALTLEEQRLFSFHFLLAAPYTACCPRLGLSRGQFFHSVYRVQEKVGAALQAAGLFPFGSRAAARARPLTPPFKSRKQAVA